MGSSLSEIEMVVDFLLPLRSLGLELYDVMVFFQNLHQQERWHDWWWL